MSRILSRVRRTARSLWRTPWRSLGACLGCVAIAWLVVNAVTLKLAANRPVDAFLVLGGSIRREIYVAELVKASPDIPVLISSGSPDPCIWLIFQRIQAPMEKVWLENCADSTFDNFYYSAPILQQWNARHVQMITSETHLPRASWLGRILLGAHGIWVDVNLAPERGVPGNQESGLKTVLDVSRSLGWAVVSQWIQPQCDPVYPLASVDVDQWRQRGFKCEHQGNLQDSDRNPD